jgi:hypothetical protein
MGHPPEGPGDTIRPFQVSKRELSHWPSPSRPADRRAVFVGRASPLACGRRAGGTTYEDSSPLGPSPNHRRSCSSKLIRLAIGNGLRRTGYNSSLRFCCLLIILILLFVVKLNSCHLVTFSPPRRRLIRYLTPPAVSAASPRRGQEASKLCLPFFSPFFVPFGYNDFGYDGRRFDALPEISAMSPVAPQDNERSGRWMRREES